MSKDQSLSRRLPKSLGLCESAATCCGFQWMKRAASKLWTDWILCCHVAGKSRATWVRIYRHGTLSLYAALDTKTGEVIGKTAPRHTSQEFVAFLSDIVGSQPRGREIHIIADNFSAHKTKLVKQFLESHPKVKLHYTPTYSSWLNQVELWFAKIERDVIARGIFTSVTDLKRKLMKYIRHYNETSQPIKWKYNDPSKRITTSNVAVTGVVQVRNSDGTLSEYG